MLVKKPAVSIGMPVFNGSQVIEAAIRSIQEQTFKDFELIISDNASTDTTEIVVRNIAQHDPRIRYIRHNKNHGMNNNGIYVLKEAIGEFFMWSAHDDQWHPQFIEKCIARFEQNPSLIMVNAGVEFFDNSRNNIDIIYPPLRTVGLGLRDRVASVFKELNVGYNVYGLYKRTALQSINLQIPCFAGDVVVLLQLMFKGEVDHVPEKLFRYRFVKRTKKQHAISQGLISNDNYPTRIYTILAINLLRGIWNSGLPASIRRILLSDAITIICMNNYSWCVKILEENPEILALIDTKKLGLNDDTQINKISVISGFLNSYVYDNAPFEGDIDFSDKEIISDITMRDLEKPGPSEFSFYNDVSGSLKDKHYTKGIDIYKQHRSTMPDTVNIRILDKTINSFHPSIRTRKSDILHLNILFTYPQSTGSMYDFFGPFLQSVSSTFFNLGHSITVDSGEDVNYDNFDIIHVFGCHDSEQLELLFDKSFSHRRPIIYSPLQDCRPRYYGKCLRSLEHFTNYIEQGQTPGLFSILNNIIPEKNSGDLVNFTPGLNLAHQVITFSELESQIIGDISPNAKISEIPPGIEIPEGSISSDLFAKTFLINNFILCVAPLTIINNQLMLLKAMENDPTPIVLLFNSTISDEYYVELCRKFKRKGPTLILNDLPDDLLMSSYKSSKVHCLPSWFEYPGYFSLQAYSQNCRVVASINCFARQYLKDDGLYCNPESADSIRASILNAFAMPKKPEAFTNFPFTINATATALEKIYFSTLSQLELDEDT